MIVERAPKMLHPECPTPGWWDRQKLRVKEDDVWQCPVCGIRWVWQNNGLGAIFWQPKFGIDTAKSLVVHHGYDPENGMLVYSHPGSEHEELVALKNRFWENR